MFCMREDGLFDTLQERIAGLSRLEKVKKKSFFFFTWPYRGHRRNPFFSERRRRRRFSSTIKSGGLSLDEIVQERIRWTSHCSRNPFFLSGGGGGGGGGGGVSVVPIKLVGTKHCSVRYKLYKYTMLI